MTASITYIDEYIRKDKHITVGIPSHLQIYIHMEIGDMSVNNTYKHIYGTRT